MSEGSGGSKMNGDFLGQDGLLNHNVEILNVESVKKYNGIGNFINQFTGGQDIISYLGDALKRAFNNVFHVTPVNFSDQDGGKNWTNSKVLGSHDSHLGILLDKTDDGKIEDVFGLANIAETINNKITSSSDGKESSSSSLKEALKMNQESIKNNQSLSKKSEESSSNSINLSTKKENNTSITI